MERGGYMARRCGAWQVGDDRDGGEVEFRIFFPPEPDPEIEAISVVGDIADVALERDDSDPEGTFWTGRSERLDKGYYEYKYRVTFPGGMTRDVSDPCTRYGGFTDQRAAIAVGGSTPEDNLVEPLAGGRRPLADLNVYELMIDDFTAEYRADRAPLDAVVEKLDDLRDLGFNAILFMPWTAWKNDDFDWGYEPFQYFAIEPRYASELGAPEEKLSWLKRLVTECHRRGIHVIMDGVFNHVSRDFPYKWLYRDPERSPYAGEFGGHFEGLQDLDFDNACTGELIRDVCLYWIETFGIDGLRLDNTINYYVAGNTAGLPQLIADVREAVDDPAFSITLEHISENAADVTDRSGATSFWDNALYGLCFDRLWNGGIDGRLINALNDRTWVHGPGALPTLYLSNHDHSHVAWQAGARENVGAAGRWYRTQPFAIALFTSTATPLVPNGQEFGEDHFIPEDDHGTGRRVIPRPLRWKLAGDPIGRALLHLYGTMARMRLAHPALRSGEMWPASWALWQTRFDDHGVGVDQERGLAIYHRWAALDGGGFENFIIVLNFSDAGQGLTVPFPLTGLWTDLLNGWTTNVRDFRHEIGVNANWGCVLRKD